ncbi:MAG: DMT family transporter [Firmicutes bacterium]|nr:DMT family transporter [Bacillota bacterium]
MKQKQLGIIYIITSAFFFALMSFFVRLSGDLPVIQKSFFRNLVAFFVALFILLKEKQSFKIGHGNMKYMLIRATAGTLGILCNFYAVDHLNLADASILNKLSPFFAVIFSIFLLKEKVKLAEWLTLAVAFIGAIFVIKPSFTMEFIYAVIGILGGISAGLAYTCVRKLGTRGVKGSVIVIFFSGFSCLVTLPQIIFNYKPMTLQQLIFLLLAGCAAAGGQLTITAAYTKAPAKEISVFDYSQIIFTTSLGFLFLNQIPDTLSIIGYIIIVGAAIFKWRYNMKHIEQAK